MPGAATLVFSLARPNPAGTSNAREIRIMFQFIGSSCIAPFGLSLNERIIPIRCADSHQGVKVAKIRNNDRLETEQARISGDIYAGKSGAALEQDEQRPDQQTAAASHEAAGPPRIILFAGHASEQSDPVHYDEWRKK